MSSQSTDARRELIGEVQAAMRGLHNAVDTLSFAIAENLGVNRTDFRCLQMLGQFGPMTAGQLAEASGLTTGAVTSVIDRLENTGFARRVRDKEDRRRVYVELTPSAALKLRQVYSGLIQASSATMEDYSDEELRLIREFAIRGRQVTLQHAERVRTFPAGLDGIAAGEN